MAAARKGKIVEEYIPDDRILRYDLEKLSDMAIRQLKSLQHKLEIQLTNIYGLRRPEMYLFQISNLLILEGAVIE